VIEIGNCSCGRAVAALKKYLPAATREKSKDHWISPRQCQYTPMRKMSAGFLYCLLPACFTPIDRLPLCIPLRHLRKNVYAVFVHRRVGKIVKGANRDCGCLLSIVWGCLHPACCRSRQYSHSTWNRKNCCLHDSARKKRISLQAAKRKWRGRLADHIQGSCEARGVTRFLINSSVPMRG